jgi:SET domain-containing protein
MKKKRNRNKSKKPIVSKDYYHTSKLNLILKPSSIQGAGLGVFTMDFIPENTIIDEYKGELIETMEPIYDKYCYEIQSMDKEKNIPSIYVSALKLPRCYMAMINDASYNSQFTNNCDFQESIEHRNVFVVSTRDIEPGEELFVVYGESYWDYFKKHPEWE